MTSGKALWLSCLLSTPPFIIKESPLIWEIPFPWLQSFGVNGSLTHPAVYLCEQVTQLGPSSTSDWPKGSTHSQHRPKSILLGVNTQVSPWTLGMKPVGCEPGSCHLTCPWLWEEGGRSKWNQHAQGGRTERERERMLSLISGTVHSALPSNVWTIRRFFQLFISLIPLLDFCHLLINSGSNCIKRYLTQWPA